VLSRLCDIGLSYSGDLGDTGFRSMCDIGHSFIISTLLGDANSGMWPQYRMSAWLQQPVTNGSDTCTTTPDTSTCHY